MVVTLAALAVGLLVLTEQAHWLRLGVVAALWAALAGAFAAAQYRRELLGHTDRADELQRVYELELEREVSARREYELEVETSARRRVEQEVRDEVRSELDGLRTELRTLRQNLEVLLGGEVMQPVAPRAESTRLPSPLPPAQAGSRTEVLPRYRQGPPSTEPVAFGDQRQPDQRQPRAAQQEHHPPVYRTGRRRAPVEDPPQLPACQHRATEPASDPLGVDQLMAEQRVTAEHSPQAPAPKRFDSWVPANQLQPETNGAVTPEFGGEAPQPRRRHRREA